MGAAGIAGVVGTAAAFLGGTTAVAAPTPDRPTDGDRERLIAALSLEIAATELYNIAAAELPEDIAALAMVMSSQHQAYVDAIAGAIGASWSEVPAAPVLGELSAAFATSDPQAFGAVARELENVAVATHTALIAEYESVDAISLTASIIPVESRHSVVLTSLAGFASNLDEMLGNDAEALIITGGAA